MRYFKVTMDSVHMCGFTSYGYVAAETLEDVTKTPEYIEFADDMFDYVSGWVDEDDFEENEDADAISTSIDEITEEEYNEAIELNDGRHHWVG